METTKGNYISQFRISDQWIDVLWQTTKEANEDGKKVFIVTIARKMARLFEFYENRYSKLNEVRHGFNGIRNEVITEHALPFVLDARTPEDTTVIIVDDFIVFGDTVETVAQNSLALLGSKPTIIALAASESVYGVFSWGNLLYPERDSKSIIAKDEIPAYTARNSWCILSLRRPIDLEHTILKVNFSSRNVKELAESLEETLSITFPEANVYRITHAIPGKEEPIYNVSVCFDTNGAGINNDFNKLRFFIRENQLEIVSFAPNIWNGDILEESTVSFNTPMLKECWNMIRQKLANPIVLGFADIPSPFQASVSSDLKIRKELSAVIMANYLLSFFNLVNLKGRLTNALQISLGKDYLTEVVKDDLCLLVGNDFSEHISVRLSQFWVNDLIVPESIKNRTAFSKEYVSTALVPEKYKKAYDNKRFLAAYLGRSVDAALAMIFHSMWKEIGNKSNRDREDRIRVGETYDSLYERLKSIYPDKKLNKNIHRWIDTSIDLGSVVPKYEYSVNPLRQKIWRRYFRSGEREDVMTDIAKAAYCVLAATFEKECFEFDEFEDRLSKVFSKLNAEYDDQVDLSVFKRGIHRGKSADAFIGLLAYMVGIEYIIPLFNDGDSTAMLQYEGEQPLCSKSAIVTLPVF